MIENEGNLVQKYCDPALGEYSHLLCLYGDRHTTKASHVCIFFTGSEMIDLISVDTLSIYLNLMRSSIGECSHIHGIFSHLAI